MVDTATSRPSRAPVIVAAALLAVVVALVVVLFTVIRPDRHHASSTASKGLSATELQAVDAAKLQVKNMLTYKRSTFEADFARTEAGATAALLSDLNAQKATLLGQLTTNKFDLDGTVTAAAFEESTGTSYAVLVSAQGYSVDDTGARTLKSRARFEITMSHSGGHWLASNLVSVGLI